MEDLLPDDEESIFSSQEKPQSRPITAFKRDSAVKKRPKYDQLSLEQCVKTYQNGDKLYQGCFGSQLLVNAIKPSIIHKKLANDGEKLLQTGHPRFIRFLGIHRDYLLSDFALGATLKVKEFLLTHLLFANLFFFRIYKMEGALLS